MEEKEILKQFTEVFAAEIDVPDTKLEMTTKPYDVEDWDSLFNVQLLVAVEKHFGVRFQSTDIATFRTVGDWVHCINTKIGR